MTNEETFSMRLNRIMAREEVSIRRTAHAIGIPVSTLHNWTAGHTPHDFKSIKRLADYLGVSFQYLCIGTDEEAM